MWVCCLHWAGVGWCMLMIFELAWLGSRLSCLSTSSWWEQQTSCASANSWGKQWTWASSWDERLKAVARSISTGCLCVSHQLTSTPSAGGEALGWVSSAVHHFSKHRASVWVCVCVCVSSPVSSVCVCPPVGYLCLPRCWMNLVHMLQPLLNLLLTRLT